MYFQGGNYLSTVSYMFFLKRIFFSGGLSYAFTCPTGYSLFIDTCVNISGSLPAATSYAGAMASCLASGQQILTTDTNLYLKEVIRSYLNNIGAAQSIWIGPLAG
jgi:hypothetical protein